MRKCFLSSFVTFSTSGNSCLRTSQWCCSLTLSWKWPTGSHVVLLNAVLESSWNVMAHGDAWDGKWMGNWRMEWVASSLHTTSEHGVSSITTADVHTLAASSRLSWRPYRFKWTRPFWRKTKSGFCACAVTFQTQCPKSHVTLITFLMTVTLWSKFEGHFFSFCNRVW